MAYLRNTVVKQAQSWIGCKESDGSHKQIIDLYNSNKPLARGYKVKYTDAWCATFVSAVAIKVGYTAIIPTECGCGEMISLFKKLGEWQENDAYVPSAGDIIFYDWDDSGSGDNAGSSDHVGIVEKVSGGTITVIEGNYSDSVKRRTIAVNGRYIRGYGVPKYTDKGSATTKVPANNTTDPKAIWTYLMGKIGNAFGVAGLMGNLYAESGLIPNNLQNTYNTKLGYTDAAYTAAVDDGSYTNFVKDSAGYGLAQWTYWSRKQALKEYADSKNASIGNLNMQLEFLYKELSENYAAVLKILKAATSVLEASNAVLLQYERPANTGTSVQSTRATYSQKYYDAYAATGATQTGGSTSSKGDTVYTVVKGDTLSSIAAKYGTTYQKLAQYNGISNPNLITIGQKIRIPSATSAATFSATSGSSNSSTPATKPSYKVGQVYTLQVELKVRTGAGTSYTTKTHSQLTADGQKHDTDRDGALEKGTQVTCLALKTVGSDIWMQVPSGWIAAYYQGDVYVR